MAKSRTEIRVGAVTYKGLREAAMTGPLTYPPEIVIESTIDLPPEYDLPGHGMSGEMLAEVLIIVIEVGLELLGGGGS
jgi:hypothetical protein